MAAVEILSFDDFLRQERAWSELVEACPHPLPFTSHPWIRTWWRCFGKGQRFVAPVVREGDVLLAGAALAVRTVRLGPLPIEVCELAGTGPVPTRGMGLADKAELLIRCDHEEAGRHLWAALVEFLGRVDLVHLKGFDPASATGALLAAPGAGVRARLAPRSRSPFVELPATRSVDPGTSWSVDLGTSWSVDLGTSWSVDLGTSWSTYLGTRSKSLRKTLRRKRKALDAAGRVEIVRLGPGDDPRAWMQEVVAVSARSRQAQEGTDLFRHPELRRFFSELAVEMAAHRMLDLHLLRFDGRACAYELCFEIGKRVFSYNGAYDPALARLSPGTLLTAAVIEDACHRGRIAYDLLRGEEQHKQNWTSRSRTEYEAVLHSGGWRARLHDTVGIGLKQRLRSVPLLQAVDRRLTGLLTRLRHRG